MPDDTQAILEQTDTATPMPSETKPAEENSEDLSLPDGVSERTKEQFEKLKAQLAEAKAQAQQANIPQTNSVLEDLYPRADNFSHLNQQQVEAARQQAISENGEVDIALLNQLLDDANTRARQAEETARQAMEQARRFEETQQVRDAHQVFPQLDPKGKQFDPNFYKLVKNELIGQMMHGEQNLIKAAQAVSQYYQPAQAQPQVVEDVSQKEQASSGASTGQATAQPIDQSDLIRRTIKGDMNAVYERLKRSGY